MRRRPKRSSPAGSEAAAGIRPDSPPSAQAQLARERLHLAVGALDLEGEAVTTGLRTGPERQLLRSGLDLPRALRDQEFARVLEASAHGCTEVETKRQADAVLTALLPHGDASESRLELWLLLVRLSRRLLHPRGAGRGGEHSGHPARGPNGHGAARVRPAAPAPAHEPGAARRVGDHHVAVAELQLSGAA